MFSIKFELAGKKRTLFFGVDIGTNTTSDELGLCVEHAGLPDTVTLRKIEDEWVKAGIIT